MESFNFVSVPIKVVFWHFEFIFLPKRKLTNLCDIAIMAFHIVKCDNRFRKLNDD